MKPSFSKIILMLFLLAVTQSHFVYSQNALFEFGKLQSLDRITAGATDKGTLLKWFNVNTNKETWTVQKDGSLICSGQPIGVSRSEKQYENFILHVEWKHFEPGGNSGIFVWSSARTTAENPLPNGVEVQMLELDWVNRNVREGVKPPVAYVHGELFGVGDVKTVPDNPRGDRSKSVENRAKGRGEWNTYDVICVDGVIKLSVNGKFVNGISKSTQKKGYICLESEGARIQFRNLKIIELPPGVISADQTAVLLP